MSQVVVIIAYLVFLLLTCLAGWTWLKLLSFCCRSRDDACQTGSADAFLMGTAVLGLLSYLVLGVSGRMSLVAYWSFAGLQCLLAIPGLWFAVRWFRPQKIGNWSLGILFLIWGVVLATYAAQLPLLGYDARAIYGLKAKILADGASVWGPDFRDPYRLHFASNYPLLIPIMESFFFEIRLLFDSGRPWNDVGLPLLFWAFVVAGTALVENGTQRFARGWGFFAVLIWAITPMVWRWTEGAGLSGSADLPFAVFTAAAVIRMADGWAKHNSVPLLVAGIYLGAATLIKQEGNIALGIIIVMIVFSTLYKRNDGESTQEGSYSGRRLAHSLPMIASFSAGVIPFLLLNRWIHTGMPQQPYMRSYVSAVSLEWLTQVVDRPWAVLSFALKELTGNHWGAVWFCLVFALLMRRKRPVELPVRLLRLFLLLLLTSYLGIFVITPYPLAYHLSTACARLVSHALPLVVMVLVEQLAATGWLADLQETTACCPDADRQTVQQNPADGQKSL